MMCNVAVTCCNDVFSRMYVTVWRDTHVYVYVFWYVYHLS